MGRLNLTVRSLLVLALFVLLVPLGTPEAYAQSVCPDPSDPSLLLCDDFNELTLDTSVWTYDTNSQPQYDPGYSLDGNNITIRSGTWDGAGAWIFSKASFVTNGQKLVYEVRATADGSLGGQNWTLWKPFVGAVGFFVDKTKCGLVTGVRVDPNPPTFQCPSQPVDWKAWHTYRIELTDNGADFFVDDALVASFSEVPQTTFEIILNAGNIDNTVEPPPNHTLTVDYVRLTRVPLNTPPDAIDDAFSANEDVPLNVPAPGVLGNDVDVDGDALMASPLSSPSFGSLVLNTDGSFTYTPNLNYFGPDGFTYQACDTSGECDPASVTITVIPVNDLPTISVAQPSVTVDEGQTATNSGSVSDVDGGVVTLTASVGTVTNNGDGTWTWSFTTIDGPTQSQTVTITADDGNGGTSQVTFGLTVINVPPTVNAGPDQTVYRNDVVTLSGTWTDPAGSFDDPYLWSWDLNGDGAPDSNGSASYGTSIAQTTSFALGGVYTLTFQISDKDGGSGSDALIVTVLNHPPSCDGAYPSQDFLWPPLHQMELVNVLGVTDPDGDPITITITSIYQDEPTNGLGDGDVSPDGQGLGTSTAMVRAERSGVDNGRMYHIGYTADDGQGGTCSSTVFVGVRHDQGKKGEAVDDGPLYDSTFP